jgi:hypothetical protein
MHASNDAFVDALYQDVLGRSDDPAEHAAALAALNGGLSRTALAQVVVFSDEARLLVVEGDYTTFLQRAGDPGGRLFYLQTLQGGATDATLAAHFAGSSEFLTDAGNAVP